MSKIHDVHVVSTGTGWRVTRASRTVSTHRTQRRAIEIGTRLARRTGAELVTHARNGRIRSKDSYGREGSAHDVEH